MKVDTAPVIFKCGFWGCKHFLDCFTYTKTFKNVHLTYAHVQFGDTLVCKEDDSKKIYGSNEMYVVDVFTEEEVFKTISEDEVCALSSKNRFLYTVPEKLKTYKICMHYVSLNGYNLSFVPPELKDKRMCLTAILDNSASFSYTPFEFFDEDLCLLKVMCGTAVSEYMPSSSSLAYFPNHLKTHKVCALAVELDGCELDFVPEKLVDMDMCWDAVRSDPKCLKCVPNQFRTEDMQTFCKIIEMTSLLNLPKDLGFSDLYEMAVRNEATTLKYIPNMFITEHMCLEAVSKDGCLLEYVPPQFKTKHVYKAALAQNWKCHVFIDDKNDNDDDKTFTSMQRYYMDMAL
jgi:hypothetical protein